MPRRVMLFPESDELIVRAVFVPGVRVDELGGAGQGAVGFHPMLPGGADYFGVVDAADGVVFHSHAYWNWDGGCCGDEQLLDG